MASSSAAGAQLPVLSPLSSNPVYLRVRLLGMFCCLWPSAGVAGPGEMLCCLPMFSSQSEPERSLLSFLTPTTLSGSSQPAGAVPIMESGCGATSLKRQIDTIALHVVREGASWKQKQGVPLRALIIENAGVVDCVRDLSDKNALSSAISLNSGAWYAQVRRSLTQVVFLFFLSFIQAMYGGESFDHNPNKRNEHDSAKFALELAWDALTVFCMDADHVALLCLHLNDWHTYLHTHFLKKVFGMLEAAIPEELMLMKRPRYGESPPIAPDGRPLRLNFTTICTGCGWGQRRPRPAGLGCRQGRAGGRRIVPRHRRHVPLACEPRPPPAPGRDRPCPKSAASTHSFQQSPKAPPEGAGPGKQRPAPSPPRSTLSPPQHAPPLGRARGGPRRPAVRAFGLPSGPAGP